MPKVDKKKICIVVSSLSTGGAERSSALLSEILYDLGHEIHMVSVHDRIDYPYKGELLNLGKLKAKNDSSFGRFKRLKVFKTYLKDFDIDVIIDNRARRGFLKELVISKWLYRSIKTIYCVRHFNTSLYINPRPIFGRWLYESAFKIVCVSKAISEKLNSIYKFNNLQVIYNPIQVDQESETTQVISTPNKDQPFILFYGRLDDKMKNVSLLLEAYSKSALPKANVTLKILGDGEDKALLKERAITLNISDFVVFSDFKKNPFNDVKTAYFTVLTSRQEGFPRVIIESLALGTPVVSVDCESGPNEIIQDEYNGLLVENYNVNALVNAMNRMVDDKDLYLQCKSNAKASVKTFSKSAIGSQWQELLK